MEATEKRRLETELLSMGLAGLSASGDPSPELIQQIAAMVNAWQGSPNRHGEWIDRHKFLRDLLAECDQADRSEMYSAITPHLNFTPYPLAQYETMMTERMGRLVSKRAARQEGRAPHPIQVGRRKFRRARASEATHAILTLVCWNCGKERRFLGETEVGTRIAARDAGWVLVPKAACKVCAKVHRKLEGKQSSRGIAAKTARKASRFPVHQGQSAQVARTT
jgi:hypothetical protein